MDVILLPRMASKKASVYEQTERLIIRTGVVVNVRLKDGGGLNDNRLDPRFRNDG